MFTGLDSTNKQRYNSNLILIILTTLTFQENQNLENGSMGGEETKLREELAAMTKKATDLEVVIMMMMGMLIRWPTISCFLTK